MLDVLIRDGWVADGAGSPPFLGDVAIEGGKIAEVGRLGDGATADARDRRDRQGRLPRLRRPAQPQRLLAPREPDRREHDPPGRHDRGRRQLRLELRAGHRPLARVHEQPAAHVRLRRARRSRGRPSASTSSSSSDVGPHAEPRLVRRPQRDPARGRRLRLAPTAEQLAAMEGFVARGDGGRRARHVDRARVQPGPRGDDRRSSCA